MIEEIAHHAFAEVYGFAFTMFAFKWYFVFQFIILLSERVC